MGMGDDLISSVANNRQRSDRGLLMDLPTAGRDFLQCKGSDYPQFSYAVPMAFRTFSGVAGDSTHLPIAF